MAEIPATKDLDILPRQASRFSIFKSWTYSVVSTAYQARGSPGIIKQFPRDGPDSFVYN